MNKPHLLFFISVCFIILLFSIFLHCNTVEPFELSSSSDNYTAVIIEPREHKALSFVLKNIADNLDDRWNIILFHGTENITYIKDILSKLDENIKKRITLKNLEVKNLTIDDYNKLLMSSDFYKNIPTEIFLVFQTDSIICSENKELIYNFMDYDYIGAPWPNQVGHGGKVGNGGFSLRRKSKMLEVLQKCDTIKPNMNEDVYFSQGCDSVKVNIPKPKIAKMFSVEQVYSSTSFGLHKPWAYLNESEISKTQDRCNGLKELIVLNN